MDKKQEYLDLSLKHLQIADHIAYVTFPLVNEKKLLLKIFEEVYKSLINLISALLVFENQKNNVLPHAKVCGLNGTCFLDARESPHSKECGFQDSRHKKNKIKLYKDNNENVKNPQTKAKDIPGFLSTSRIISDNSLSIKNFIKLSHNYNINPKEIKKILEIIEINNIHKNSAMEFVRGQKVVIMQDDLELIVLDMPKIKEYLNLSKKLYVKSNLIISN